MRFFVRRLQFGLRNAKSADTAAVLKELIADAEERLDRFERGIDGDRAAGRRYPLHRSTNAPALFGRQMSIRRAVRVTEGPMSRLLINRISAIAPFIMSLAAFLLVLVAVAAGWDKGAKDEGSAAPIFHGLIALQIPFILTFLMTADWKRFLRVVGVVSADRSGCVGLRSRPLLQAVIAASCHCRSLDGDALLLRQPCNFRIVGGISGFDGAVQFGPRLPVVCGQLRILKGAPRNIVALRTWIALYGVPSG